MLVQHKKVNIFIQIDHKPRFFDQFSVDWLLNTE